MSNKDMPVIKPPAGCAKSVPIEALSNHRALIVHGQSLERLAERGGLSPLEIYMNYHGVKPDEPYLAVNLVNSLAELNKQPGGEV